MIRVGQLALVVAAGALWGASRMTWVQITTFDGLGHPQTAELNGATWSTALIPLALVVLAAAGAALAVRGWPLRVLALLVAVASAAMAYLAISLWVVEDVAVRAARLAEVPIAERISSTAPSSESNAAASANDAPAKWRSVPSSSAAKGRAETARYRRGPAVAADQPSDAMSERMMWDALDEGADPTADRVNPDSKGR